MVVDRFDGVYGRAYDLAMSHPLAMRATRVALGRSTVLGDVPFLVRVAYSYAPEEPLLDVPCGAAGSMVHGWQVGREAPVLGVDLSERMIERGRQRLRRLRPAFEVQLEVADALALPFGDGSFGAALSVNGLHCMPDPAAFASELARVVRPGGSLWLTTLVDAGSPGSRAANGLLRRGGVLPAPPPSPDRLRSLLQEAGWSHIEPLGGRALVGLRCTR